MSRWGSICSDSEVEGTLEVRVQGQTESARVLRAFLDRLEWTPEQLAREINRLAGQEIVSTKAPYYWLRGTVPRDRRAQLAAAAISRGIGETISVGVLWPDRRGGSVALAAHHGLDLPWDATGAVRCAELIAQPTGSTLLAATGPMLVTCAVDWLTVPTAAPPTRTVGEPLTHDAIDVLRERIGQLRRLDDSQAGPMLLEWVVGDLRWAAALATGTSYGREGGAALFNVLAELAQVAGWCATDLDRFALGQRFLLAALRFAHASHDRALAANVLSCLSYQVLWTGDADSAIRIIRLARQSVDGHVNPLVGALLASREGRAHAARGDREGCGYALEEAAACFAEYDAAAERAPAWAYWVSEGVLAADAGRAWLEIGDAHKAVALLERGLDLLGADQPRNRVLHGLSLAQAHLELNQFDAVAHFGHQALEVRPAIGSERVRDRMKKFRGALQQRRTGETDLLAQRITDTLSA